MVLQTSGSLALSQIITEIFPDENPVNSYNWYTTMSVIVDGFTPITSGVDPNVQMQLTDGNIGRRNFLYQNSKRIQDNYSFTLTFELYVVNNSSGDFINLYFGGNGSSVKFSFALFENSGINLYDASGTMVVRNTNTTWVANAWIPIVINYNRGTFNTWSITINNVNIFTYSDPLNTGWISSTSGDQWGFDISNATTAFTSYVRKINLITTQSPSQKIVTPLNWSTLMTSAIISGSYTPTLASSDPNIQVQLTSGLTNQRAVYYMNNRVQDNKSFIFSCQSYMVSGSLDNFGMYFGATDINGSNGIFILYNTWSGYTNNGFSGVGVYIIKVNVAIAFASISFMANAWIPIGVNYSNSTTDTWIVSYNGSVVLKYDDPSNATWVSSTSGSYWCIRAHSGGTVGTFYFRQLLLSYIPKSIDFNSLRKITSGIPSSGPVSLSSLYRKRALELTGNYFNYFPPCSMTSAVTSTEYGTFTVTGSSDIGSAPWTAFRMDNSTWEGRFWNSSGTYNSTATTTVSGVSYAGEWIQLRTPYPINVFSYTMTARQEVNLYCRAPTTFYLAGSNDGSTWSLLHNISGVVWGAAAKTFICNQANTNTYTYFRIISTVIGTGALQYNIINFGNIKFYNTPNTTCLATDLGPYGMAPWGVGEWVGSITDGSARWLWSADVVGVGSTPNNMSFQITYNNTTTTNISAKLMFSIDNYGQIFQNKTKIYTGGYSDSVQVVIPPGINLFEFICWNALGDNGGSAGLIFSCTNNTGGAVLFRSDNSSATALTNSSKTVVATNAPLWTSINGIANQGFLTINPLPVLDDISTAAKLACRGAYSCYRLSNTYTGAIMNIRRSSDNATTNVYADIQGNLGLSANGTGTTFSSWLGASTAYVVTWYDQSGTGNNATQTTNANQPIFSLSGMLIDSENSSTQFMNIPSGTVPVGTLNAPYSFVFKHGSQNNIYGTYIGGGDITTNTANGIRGANDTSAGYNNFWWGNDFSFGTISQRVANNRVVVTYDGSSQSAYINSNLISTITHTGGTTSAGQQYLFTGKYGNYLNGKMYYVYIFGSGLSDSDRLILSV